MIGIEALSNSTILKLFLDYPLVSAGAGVVVMGVLYALFIHKTSVPYFIHKKLNELNINAIGTGYKWKYIGNVSHKYSSFTPYNDFPMPEPHMYEDDFEGMKEYSDHENYQYDTLRVNFDKKQDNVRKYNYLGYRSTGTINFYDVIKRVRGNVTIKETNKEKSIINKKRKSAFDKKNLLIINRRRNTKEELKYRIRDLNKSKDELSKLKINYDKIKHKQKSKRAMKLKKEIEYLEGTVIKERIIRVDKAEEKYNQAKEKYSQAEAAFDLSSLSDLDERV
ncbi:MAG: hypothetical protein V3T32_04110 [Thermodesulfobacteriota bacterium]